MDEINWQSAGFPILSLHPFARLTMSFMGSKKKFLGVLLHIKEILIFKMRGHFWYLNKFIKFLNIAFFKVKENYT